VQLEAPAQPAPEHGFTLVPAYSMPREAARQALQRALDRFGVVALRRDFLWHGRNERKLASSSAGVPRWMSAAAVLLALVVVGLAVRQWWGTSDPLASEPVIPAIVAPAPPPPAPVVEVTPAPATSVNPRHAQAQAHVEGLLKATERSAGYTPDQIERVVSHFADPTFIEEKGMQPAAGVRATLQVLADQWPSYREQIMDSQIDTLEDGTVTVLVKTNYVGRNPARGTEASGGWHTRYVVRFGGDGQPLISRIEFPSQKL
jgi:hypothetical protein